MSNRQPGRGDGDQDDERFFREYSKALAQALLENEDGSSNTKISKQQLVKGAYKALCHDDPRVDSDEACRLLASSLARDNSGYALSLQLVEGIRQATSRNTESSAAVDTTREEQADILPTSLNTVGTATAAGYASVAVAAFVEVPLGCCQSRDKSQIECLLGSYRRPAAQEKADLEQAETTIPMHSPLIPDSSDNEGDDHDPLEEIFAEESDPEDFEYESGHADAAHHLAWESFVSDMDPATLSRPPANSDWSDLRCAVANLLTELTYSKLASLSSQQWKKLRLSDILTQLALTLLVPPPPSDLVKSPLLLRDEQDEACVELRRMGIQPLYCLRDRAMDDYALSSSQQDDALNDYIMLVQTLLGVDSVLLQSGTSGSTQPLAPATVIGMASLSALCSSLPANKSMQTKIRKSVLENVEDLASIVERTVSTSDQTDGIPPWVRLTLALLPLLHLMSGIHADGTALQIVSLSNSEAQLLLNSGFFREVLLLYTGTETQDVSPTSVFVRTQLVRALLVLCVQSTTLLGKYAWRVPQLSSCLSRQEWRQSQCLDSILFLLLGKTILESSGGGSRLRPVGAAKTTEPTVESCRQEAFQSWSEMCLRVVHAMEALQKSRECANNKSGDTSDWKQQHEGAVVEFTRFTNLLNFCPAFCRMWLSSILSGGSGVANVEKHVQEIRQSVSNIPAVNIHEQKSIKDEPKKTADNDKLGIPIARAIDTNQDHVTNVKRGLKVLSLLLQEDSEQHGSNISSKTD